jgi:hypothetical protein
LSANALDGSSENSVEDLSYKPLQLRSLAASTKPVQAEALLLLRCFSGTQSLIVL